MNQPLELTLPSESFVGLARMNYETPPGGISITGYVARRLHKTALLTGIEAAHAQNPALALIQFGIYAAASATSWGPALYQPRFERPGAVVTEADPATGAAVTVRYVSSSPHYIFAFEVRLPDGGYIRGEEAITGTTVGLRGLGMPAPSRYDYRSADGRYSATGVGTINSELAPRLLGTWQIRGYGRLQLDDNAGSSGSVTLNRDGRMDIQACDQAGQRLRTQFQLR